MFGYVAVIKQTTFLFFPTRYLVLNVTKFHLIHYSNLEVELKMSKIVLIVLLLALLVCKGSASLWCYQCVSTQPGCGTPLNWLWHWTNICPEDDDVCVKIIEQKDGDTVITRDCLSSMRGIRTDIPADHYEGCRPAAVDLKLANFVNNSIKELDIYRNYYDNTTWCFCFLDHRCNNALNVRSTIPIAIFSILCTIFFAQIR